MKKVGMRKIGWVLVLACLASMSACTVDNHDLPTLGGKRPTGSPLVQTAKNYYDCMSSAGISVELAKNGDGDLTIVNFRNFSYVIYRTPDGSGGMMVLVDWDPSWDRLYDEVFSGEDDEPRLLIDGMDHSQTYARCLEETGYDESAAWVDGGGYMPDPADLERQVRANNLWASCARDNGWPMIADSVMPAVVDGFTWPEILLPPTITEQELRALLKACPNFDPAQQEALEDWWSSGSRDPYPPDYLPSPNIGLDIGDFWSKDPDGVIDPDMEAQQDYYYRLYEILWELQNEYYEKKGG